MNKLKAQRYLISGASGLVGRALVQALTEKGQIVCTLVRHKTAKPSEVYYDWEKGEIERDKLEGFDVVIHLAGENIAAKRWSVKQKQKISDSRTKSTNLITAAIAELSKRPKLFLCASAVGYYGDTTTLVDESSPKGEGFLPNSCFEWEEEARPARDAGVRVVNARFGVVLSPHGGAIAKMLLAFKLGLGGRLGSGKQWMSWVSLRDAVCALEFIVQTESLSGAVNVVSPNPVTNAEFTSALGSALSRPTILPVPAFAIRVIFGEMGKVLLFSNSQVSPKKLIDCGFQFKDIELKECLVDMLVTK